MSLSASVDKLFVMLKDVVYLEDKAKITKEEASTADHSTLSKVEELREMLLHAKETNNMVFFQFPSLSFLNNIISFVGPFHMVALAKMGKHCI
jgi:hypothetical protein